MLGIGTDIVDVDRVRAVWERHGLRFSDRILTPAERRHCEGLTQPWTFLARRFAAKEAIAKCLGCGIGLQLSWQDLQIDSQSSGEPLVRLSPRAESVAAGRGGTRVLISISDERAYAVAFAVLLA